MEGVAQNNTIFDLSRSDDTPERQQRVLIAEDSSITQDLLTLVLSQHGHRVDIVKDGDEALEALLRNKYDVALLDFHLPGQDGVEVVASYLAQSSGGQRPYFVAITGDVEGLLAHEANCENFDKVVPKPVDIQEISRVVEEATPQDRSARTEKQNVKPVEAPPLSTQQTEQPLRPQTVPPQFAAGRNFVRWPADFDTRNLTGRSLQATVQHGNVDALLIEEPATPADLARVWQTASLHLFPVIDMTGTLGVMADLDCSKLAANETDAVSKVIETFHNRRARLHPDALLANDISDKILARIFMSETPLKPSYNGASQAIVNYNILFDGQTVINEASKLVKSGFLSQTFFDRVHVCGNCGSSQFNVREECPECRSSNLREEPYLHHFKCAYLGPESDFRRGDDLVCPKCRRELTHFGSDYDKPGTMIVCGNCGHQTSEPMVGFVCLACGHHTDGDAIPTRDIQSYALTDKAMGFLEAGNAFLGFTQQTLRFSDLPLDLVVALNDEAKKFNENGVPFALLDISYQNAREIDKEHGPRQFSQLRNLFLENLRRTLRDEISTVEDPKIVKGQSYDFALLQQTK
ncbi:MAG: response regulator, partial [Alphaproteobacteria bacterium]